MRINEATDLSSSLVAQIIKNPPAVQETQEGRSPGAGNGYPLQWSCLENPMDTGAWQPTVHGIAKESDKICKRVKYNIA